MEKVFVARLENAREMTQNVLKGLEGADFRGKSVLIKPDIQIPASPQSGKVGNPVVVAAIIDWLRENGASEIAVGESPALGVQAKEAFSVSGFVKMAEEKGVRLIDFDNAANIAAKVSGGQRKFLTVAAALGEFDRLICVPVLRLAEAPLSLLNLRGLAWRQQKLAFYGGYVPKIKPQEATLELAFRDLQLAIRPDAVVIDGSLSVKLGTDGVVLASENAAAADEAAACFAKGEQACLQNCVPPQAAEWTKEAVCSVEETTFAPKIFLSDMDGCTSCLSAVYRFLDAYYPQLDPKKPLEFFIGYGEGQGADGCYYVGSCGGQLRRSGNGVRVAGCPPQPHQIAEAFGLKQNS